MDELIKYRKLYVEEIRKELLGPGSEICIPDAEHEIISSRPDVRYSMGILFPQKNKMEFDNDDIETQSESENNVIIDDTSNETYETDNEKFNKKQGIDDDNLDEEVSLSAQNLPSSMGISFIVNGNTDNVICTLKFATYERVKPSECKVANYKEGELYIPEAFNPYIYFDKNNNCISLKQRITRKEVRNILEQDVDIDIELKSVFYRLADQCSRGHKRMPHTVNVVLDFSSDEYIDQNKKIDDSNLKLTALRRQLRSNIYSITIMAVNDEHAKSNGVNCIYQTQIGVDSNQNNFNFVDINKAQKLEVDYEESEEELELALLYRKKHAYATGLGTSCLWEIDDYGNGTIRTEYFPQIELPPMDFNLQDKDTDYLSMKYLSDLNDETSELKINNLKKLTSLYRVWIEDRREEVQKFSDGEVHLTNIAHENLEKCDKAVKRMEEGLHILGNNSAAMDSFLLANRAMFIQREQLKLQHTLSNCNRYTGDIEVSKLLQEMDYLLADDIHKWRPFQIAFLLMSIGSIVDDKCDERNEVDLIWFPTGGGKTEAYLGLTAFTIFYRRFVHSNTSDGTTVIMRYTLRLLASQQFTRASTLICACEFIRRESLRRRSKYRKYNIGNKPITIGLWIGGKHTPNINDSANYNIKELLRATYSNLNYNKETYNKFQVLKCPWCGAKLEKDIVNGKMVGQFGYKMKNNKHFFLHCTHEDCEFNNILPIQVVDEELYENPPTLLFGTVDKFAMLPWKKEVGNFFASKNINRPPELIIQDELHLISGPLGTIVGLFETAIDGICEYKGIKPKIVASTATIRRAKEQCLGLYNRRVNQFPPPGINAEDSFFARENVIDHSAGKFGRLYMGMMPTGKSKAMMEIRSISSFLQKVFDIESDDYIKDNYWTLTVYFNSLKELGKCRTLIDDDVKDALKRLSMRMGKKWRPIGSADELTSRVTTVELNKTLDKLEKLQYSKENIKNRRYASNTLIATNMISVGIDVERLNTMILVGQPKLTSEYIQASSRVGRKYPGIASVLYDGTKSRDRSHYEQFIAYHQSYYRYVEPTSVTPFSRPAIERALHSVIVGMLRNISELDNESSAADFNTERVRRELDYIKEHILSRYNDINKNSEFMNTDFSNEIESEFDDFIEMWEKQLGNYDKEKYVYGYKYMVRHPAREEGRLMKSYNSDRNDLSAKDTLTSMRNVDSSVKGNILVWEE